MTQGQKEMVKLDTEHIHQQETYIVEYKENLKEGGTSPETQHNYPTKSEKEQNRIIFPAFGYGDLEELWT